jgi:hypothetical protein
MDRLSIIMLANSSVSACMESWELLPYAKMLKIRTVSKTLLWWNQHCNNAFVNLTKFFCLNGQKYLSIVHL